VCQVSVPNAEDAPALFQSPLGTFVFDVPLQHMALSTYNRILQLEANAISNTPTHNALWRTRGLGWNKVRGVQLAEMSRHSIVGSL
jgi:hypothetical protein